jgi:hypothetical protein
MHTSLAIPSPHRSSNPRHIQAFDGLMVDGHAQHSKQTSLPQGDVEQVTRVFLFLTPFPGSHPHPIIILSSPSVASVPSASLAPVHLPPANLPEPDKRKRPENTS